MVVPAIAIFLKKFSGDIPFIDRIDELVLLIALPLAVNGFRKLIKIKSGLMFVVFFCSYLISGIGSALINSVAFRQILYQLVLELKVPSVVFIAFGLAGIASTNSWFINRFVMFAKIILLVSIPLVIWQFIDMQSYRAVFQNGADLGMFHLTGGGSSVRGSGVFWFTGQLGIFSGTMMSYFIFCFLKYKSHKNLLWVIISLLLLLSTLSRLEIVGSIAGMTVVYFIVYGTSRRIKLIGFIVLLFPVLYFTLSPLAYYSYNKLELKDISSSEAVRVVYYNSSVRIASEYFPLGSGLGTFGGQAAVIFDSFIHHRLGFGQYWWYQFRRGMTDTFWPHVLGEAGFLGLIFFFGALWSLWDIAKDGLKFPTTSRDGDRNDFAIGCAGSSSFILLVINSLAAPNFYAPVSFLPCMLFVAFAFSGSYQLSGSTERQAFNKLKL